MDGLFGKARENIELKLILSVLLGDMEEEMAEIWKEAIRGLDDQDMRQLVLLTRGQPDESVPSVTLKFLMERSYSFREMILYQTAPEFRRRMGLEDIDPNNF